MEVMPDHIHLLLVVNRSFYFGYDQDHERKSCETVVSFTSGTEKGAVGRDICGTHLTAL